MIISGQVTGNRLWAAGSGLDMSSETVDHLCTGVRVLLLADRGCGIEDSVRGNVTMQDLNSPNPD